MRAAMRTMTVVRARASALGTGTCIERAVTAVVVVWSITGISMLSWAHRWTSRSRHTSTARHVLVVLVVVVLVVLVVVVVVVLILVPVLVQVPAHV